MQLKRGLNVAITRNTLTQNLATRGRKCDDTHQYCSNTNGCFHPGKPVASKQSACVESKRKVNESCERSAHEPTSLTPHTPPFHHLKYKSYTLRSSEALRTPLRTSEGGGRATQLVSSASTRSISRRSAASVRLATSSSSKVTMSFVISVTMSRVS